MRAVEAKKTALSRKDYLRSNVSGGIQMRAIFVTRQLLKAPRQRDKHLKSCERLSPGSWPRSEHTIVLVTAPYRPAHRDISVKFPVAQMCHGIR